MSQRTACPDCGSRRALSEENGWTHCFACGTNRKVGEDDGDQEARRDYSGFASGEALPLTKRHVSQEVARKYGYLIGTYNDKPCQIAPFFDDKGRLVAQKIRFANKDFTITGDAGKMGLFGKQLCRGHGKMIVVTEGEIDALSFCQAMGLSWPAVSLPNGAQSAARVIRRELEFLEGYDKVVLAFDADEQGQAAVEACLPLFQPGKVAVANLGGFKDANEALVAGKAATLRDAAWGATPWRPDGLVNMADLFEEISAPLEPGILYPWAGLNDKTYGFRPQELVTWTAGTGVGKSAIVSELVHSLITREDHRKVGIIYLEEGVARAGRRILGIEASTPLHLPGNDLSEQALRKAWDATLGTGRLVAYDHFGSLEEEVLLNRIRYMVKSEGCDVVVLDHISMVVSGMDLSDDERRMLDHIVTSLRSLTQETHAAIHIVSHLRRAGEGKAHEEGRAVSLSHLRGTQAIAQLSDAVIAAERNQQAETEVDRNTTTLRVLKNRYAGLTGPAGQLLYSPKTGRLSEVDGTEMITGGDDNDF